MEAALRPAEATELESFSPLDGRSRLVAHALDCRLSIPEFIPVNQERGILEGKKASAILKSRSLKQRVPPSCYEKVDTILIGEASEDAGDDATIPTAA